MKKLINLIILLAITSFTSGCASIICGDEKTINISSEPSGANFTIKNRHGNDIIQGVTPTNVTLKRGDGYFKAGCYTIEFEKAGYQKHTQFIKQYPEGGWWIVGNIVSLSLGGLFFVDPLTGAMWNIKDVEGSLQPLSEVSTKEVTMKTVYTEEINKELLQQNNLPPPVKAASNVILAEPPPDGFTD